MNARAVLTTIWVVCFVVAIVLVEGYFLRTDADGIALLIPKDRIPVYQALGLIYGGHLGAMLASWYVKPFKLPHRPELHRFMVVLAVGLTSIYNLVLLYLLAQGYLVEDESIADILERVKVIGGSLAFLTAPVNAYYFGAKQP